MAKHASTSDSMMTRRAGRFAVAVLVFLVAACGRPSGERDASATDAGADSDAPPRDGVAVMTWNLEQFPRAAGTISAVADIVNNVGPDLLAIQEITDERAFAQLANALPDYQGMTNDDHGAFMLVGLLYRTETVNIGRVETLFGDNSWAFPRPPLAVWLTVRDGDDASFDFLIVVLHLKANLDDESQERRRLACEHLEQWMAREVASGTEADIVVVGDWNDELTDRTSWNVFQVFLDRPESYTFLNLGLAQGGEFTYLPFESCIDHILVTSSALDEYGAGSTDILELDRNYPDYRDLISDHRPVLSRFQVP